MARFGVEEEFVLLDDISLAPVGIADGMRAAVTASDLLGTVTAEYLTCQVECVTSPVHTLGDGLAQLTRMRSLLADQGRDARAIVAATGTPFLVAGALAVVSSPHYDAVAAHLAHLTRGHEVNGLHVHVEVSDDEARVRALNRLRGWLPVLLALTGNSPFADGLDSRFASWRSILIRRLPATWCPPHFEDADHYHRSVARQVALGAIPDAASLSWAARLSERYPTVEARVFDTQLDPADSLFAAALTRALVLSDDVTATTAGIDEIDASLWTAARYGMEATVWDPLTDEAATAWTAVGRLLEALAPVLDELGDRAFVDDHLARIRSSGTGAERQRRAFAAAGTAGLRALYRGGADAPRAFPDDGAR